MFRRLLYVLTFSMALAIPIQSVAIGTGYAQTSLTKVLRKYWPAGLCGLAAGLCTYLLYPSIAAALAKMKKSLPSSTAESSKVKIGLMDISGCRGMGCDYKAWDYMIRVTSLFQDPNIQAIVFVIEGSEYDNIGTMQTLAHMIRQLKKAYPKPVFAYSGDAPLINSAYLLACAADSIYCSPSIWVGHMGCSMGLKSVHEKNNEDGIDFHLISKGKYKGLGHPNIPLTPEMQEAAQQFVQATHDQLVTTLCEYRPSLAENKKVWEDGKILSAQEAVEQKLIDKACDKGQLFEDIFAKLNLPFDPDLIEACQPQCTLSCTDTEEKAKIGVIRLSSLDKTSWHYMRDLRKLFADSSIQAVILAVDGFGSRATIATEVHADILRLKKLYKKPVIAYIEQAALSGAYVVVTAADYVVASPMARIGGIGCILEHVDMTKKNAKDHTSFTLVKSGEMCDLFHPEVPFNEQKKEFLQKMVDSEYDRVLTIIKQSRPALANNEPEWVDAQSYIGTQALEHKLIDQIGCQFDVFTHIKRLLGYTVNEGTTQVENIDLVMIDNDYSMRNLMFCLQ